MAHLEKVAKILEDPEATDNDRFVAYTLLQNAQVAAEGQLPSCQDTGTAIVMGKKGENVWTGAEDAEWLSKGITIPTKTGTCVTLRLCPSACLMKKIQVLTYLLK